MKKTLTLGVVACMLLMGSSVHAQTTNTTLPSAGMLPDNPLYFLEQLSEGIANFFTFGDKAKAERLFNQSEERLSEARALVEKGKSDQAEKIIAKYQERVTKALEVAKKAKESNHPPLL